MPRWRRRADEGRCAPPSSGADGHAAASKREFKGGKHGNGHPRTRDAGAVARPLAPPARGAGFAGAYAQGA
eukprot:13319274-Alexandrium_andersonii.AAC.1